ncbi:MAG: hypothetical protein ACYCY0_10425, partial [Acidithiobacillus ferrivorans]
MSSGYSEESVIATKKLEFSSCVKNALNNASDTNLLRSELFSVEQLKQHAVTLAGQHAINPYPGPDRLLPRLADNAAVLRAAYDVVTAGTAQAEQRTLAGEIWLLDNFYLIEQQIILAR